MSSRYPKYPEGTLSVTEVIKAAGLMPETDFIDPWNLGAGSARHLATALYDKGTLDESTVAPEIAGSLESWKKFRHTYTPTHIEWPLYDPVYQFCGTIDRLPLLDIKGPGKSAWQVLQLGGYWHLCRCNDLADSCNVPRTVHLNPDGNMPKVHTYSLADMREAEKVLLAALAVLRWKKNNLKGE